MRKKRESSSSGGGSWMDTYGDLVTLLLCFFVLLYSFSSVDASKWEALVKSFSGSSGVLDGSFMGNGAGAVPMVTTGPREDLSFDYQDRPFPTGSNSETAPSATVAPQPTRAPTKTPTKAPPKPTLTPKPSALTKLYADLSHDIDMVYESVGVEVEQSDHEIRIRIIASVLFEPGTDTLTPQANDILETIARIVGKYLKSIETIHTEGHTDNVSELDGDIQSKWELAARRAAHVISYLCSNSGLDPDMAYTMGFGSSRPVASNDTPEGREKNNRVDIVILE